MFKALYVEAEELVECQDGARVGELLAEKRNVWIQLSERSAEADQLLKEVLQIHPLVIEDTWNDLQIPKLDEFENYLQIIVHRIDDRGQVGKVHFDEVDVLLGRHFVVTRAHHWMMLEGSEGAVQRTPKLLKRGPAWIAHALIDRIIDEYLPYIDHYERAIEQLETQMPDAVTSARPGELAAQIFALTRALQRFRRFAMQQQEVLQKLARTQLNLIPREARPFYTDVNDHFVRVTALADSSREVLSGLLDMYWSMQSSHMNEVMKTLTLISTVMLPLTFIAGVYGMNFEFMPELKSRYGYPFILSLMAVVTLAIVAYFRRRRWL